MRDLGCPHQRAQERTGGQVRHTEAAAHQIVAPPELGPEAIEYLFHVRSGRGLSRCSNAVAPTIETSEEGSHGCEGPLSPAAQSHSSETRDEGRFMEEWRQQRRRTDLMTQLGIQVRLESKRAFALRGIPWVERRQGRNPFGLGDDQTRLADGTVVSHEDRKVRPTRAPPCSNQVAAAEGSARVGDVLVIEGPPRLFTKVGALELP